MAIVLAFLCIAGVGHAADLAVVSVKVTYRDDRTNPDEVTVRELVRFDDNDYWSKPELVDLEVVVENRGKEPAHYVTVSPELYFKLEVGEGSHYPSLTALGATESEPAVELKDIAPGAVWVWNRTFPKQAPPLRTLKPGERKRLQFSDLNIKNHYHATNYGLAAIAIRVFVNSRGLVDTDYSNNVRDFAVSYGD
jgi:hypothetical protein